MPFVRHDAHDLCPGASSRCLFFHFAVLAVIERETHGLVLELAQVHEDGEPAAQLCDVGEAYLVLAQSMSK